MAVARRWTFLGSMLAVFAVGTLARPRSASASSPSEALDTLVRALKVGKEDGIRRAASPGAFKQLQFAARGYTDGYRSLTVVFSRLRSKIGPKDWTFTDKTHASAGVSWHGGSGRHTDQLTMERTGHGWRLTDYTRIWDR